MHGQSPTALWTRQLLQSLGERAQIWRRGCHCSASRSHHRSGRPCDIRDSSIKPDTHVGEALPCLLDVVINAKCYGVCTDARQYVQAYAKILAQWRDLQAAKEGSIKHWLYR